MTDEEIRSHLRDCRRWWTVSVVLPVLGALQMGANILLFGDGSPFTNWCAFLVLGTIPFVLGAWAFVLRRDSRCPAEALHRRYAEVLAQTHLNAQRAKIFFWVWLGLGGFNAYVLSITRPGLGTVTGWSMVNLAIILAGASLHQWRRVLPRAERARAEFREAAA